MINEKGMWKNTSLFRFSLFAFGIRLESKLCFFSKLKTAKNAVKNVFFTAFFVRSISEEVPVEQPEDGEMHGIEAVEEVLGGLAAHKAPLPVIEVQEGKGTGHAAGPAQ